MKAFKSLSKKTQKALTAITMVLVVVISFLSGFFVRYFQESKTARSLSWIINLIESNYCYFDEETGEYKTFTAEDYSKAIAEGLLDDYSTYYTSEEYKDEVATRNGNRYGIGLGFLKTETTARVFSVTFNSPAERAGIKSGDLITGLTYNGEKAVIENYDHFKKELNKVLNDTEFILHVDREGENSELSFVLKRQVFVASYVKYVDSEMEYRFASLGKETPRGEEILNGDSRLSSDTAIITFKNFEGNAASQFKSALEYMKLRNRTKLILDVRNNGGGLLSVLTKVCCFITDAKGSGAFPVAYSIDKNGNLSTYNALSQEFFNNIQQISVVANGNSASATECLIGTLLHYGHRFSKDFLVIEKTGDKTTTYGKGIAQTTYYNPISGEAVTMTSDYMYWPDKTTCIHGKGISTTESNTVEENKGILRAIELLG